MKARDISHVSTADIIAALDGDREACFRVTGYRWGTWMRTAEGDAAAQRLAELSGRWTPPTGPRVGGVPPWQGGHLLGRGEAAS